MACAYAHITITEVLKRNDLKKVNIPDEIINAIASNIKYCNFGSVCPDLSYLAEEPQCSDLMHFIKTGGFVKAALEIIKTKKEKEKCIAWLFGFVSHMVTDMVIHPVIEEKVGEYAAKPENALNHRICEMHQDVYIVNEKLNLDISKCEFVDSRLKECGNGVSLDPEIINFWNDIFTKNYPTELKNRPDINKWFLCFTNMLDISEEGELIYNKSDKKVITIGHILYSGANQLIKDKGFIYPALSEIDPNGEFLSNLPTPSGHTNYLKIFEKATDEVLNAWRILSGAILNHNDEYIEYFSDWNLGTGTLSSDTKYVFWNGHVKHLSDTSINSASSENVKSELISLAFNRLPRFIKEHQYLSNFLAFLSIIIVLFLFSYFGININTDNKINNIQKVTIEQTLNISSLEKLSPRILALSGYIETALNKKLITDNASPAEIIKIACLDANDMNTFNVLNNYDIDISRNNTTAIILLGNKSKNEKYYEDHAWTGRLDEIFTSETDIKGFNFIHKLTK